MYQNILVPLDGSTRAERILPHVEELALRFEAKVILLHVLERRFIINDYSHSPYLLNLDTLKQEEEEMRIYLAGKQGEFREKGIRAEKFLEHGPVVQTIIRVAEREKADLIAMASHGRGGLARAFYGSVASGILNQVDRPLLLIRARKDD